MHVPVECFWVVLLLFAVGYLLPLSVASLDSTVGCFGSTVVVCCWMFAVGCLLLAVFFLLCCLLLLLLCFRCRWGLLSVLVAVVDVGTGVSFFVCFLFCGRWVR